jgi:dUTP pyrophosphatase
VSTGIALAVLRGIYARITLGSGLAVKHWIDIGARVIDEYYQGKINIVLINNSTISVQVRSGD